MNPSDDTSTRPPQALNDPEVAERRLMPTTTGYTSPDSTAETPTVPGFEIEAELGRGGMGVVYRARQTGLNRTVALKVILHAAHADPAEMVRFLAEAEAVAKLEHPNVVRVYQSGTAGRTPYFALEYLDGGTLADLIRDQPLEPKQAAELVERLAQAMAYSHSQGIVHRDLKPANVLLSRDGTPKVADFGLAKRLDTGSGLTATGQVMGTPSYMAPEQARGENDRINESADVYSLGAILYALLTGRPPFLGPTVHATLDQVINNDPIGPREFQAGIARDLETVCLKCLRKDQPDRYASAQALAEDLRAFLDGRSISARPMSRLERGARWVRKNPSWAATIALFAVTLLSATAVSLYFADEAHQAASADRSRAQQLDIALKEAKEEKKRRARTQVEMAVRAEAKGLSSLLMLLEEDSQDVTPVWNEILDEPATEKNRVRRRRAELAMLAVYPDWLAESLMRQLFALNDPVEMIVIRDALTPFSKPYLGDLWKRVEDPAVPPRDRFLRLIALAAFDPKNPKWPSVGDSMLQPWLSDNPLYLGTWTDALRPVRLSLISSLQKVYRGEVLPELRYVAATVLTDYAADQPEVLASLIQSGDDRQFNAIFPVLEKHRAKAIELLRIEAAKLPPADRFPDDESIAKWKPTWSQEEHEAFARKRSGAALALMRLGDTESVWPVLKSSAYPESRTRLTLRFAPSRVEVKALIERLQVETDVGVRRALILSLGEYREDQIDPESRRAVTELLLKWYRDDPDSGTHGAIDWLMRPEKEGLRDRPLKWGQREKLAAIDRDAAESARRTQLARIATVFSATGDPLAASRLLLPAAPAKSGGWWINSQGQTFAVVESREPFLMGSPETDREHRSDESLHWRKIDRKFGMATRALTVAEFERFLKANPRVHWIYRDGLKKFAPEADCPIVIVSWWEAAQYCRWLSEEEGLPEWEMVYPPVEEIERGKSEEKPLVLPANHLSRKGYRLPTEAEWEYLARAGSRTSYSFGSGLDLLPRHSWYIENAKERTWPVGQKPPNDWGLFDLSGNTFTWCQEAGFSYPAGGLDGPVPDGEDRGSVSANQGITEKWSRSYRGGSCLYQSLVVRSACRGYVRPASHINSVGLRLCRTFD